MKSVNTIHAIQPTVHYALIIECCRYEPNNIQLETLSSQIADWQGMLTSAYGHGVYPLIAKSLKTISAVPDSVKHQLRMTNLQIAQQNMMMTSELLKIMKLLEKNGIKALALKGPVLSQIIYGDVTTRQYADIDILIPRDQIYDAGKILMTHGYISEHSIQFLKNKTLLDVAKDFSIFSPTQNVHIEFHWQLFLPRQVKKSKINLFNLSNPICTINTQPILTLEQDANLIYLLIHGSKHMWERLEWVVDIDRLIRSRIDSIDWTRLGILAKEMEIEVMFYLGISLSEELFNTPISLEVKSKINLLPTIIIAKSEIVKELYADGIRNEMSKATAFKNLYKMRLNKDSFRAVFRHYWKTLFGLKYMDVYMINLPEYLWFLYHPIRIYRLMKFYLTGLSS